MEDEAFNTQLGLGLSLGDYSGTDQRKRGKSVVCLDLSFTLNSAKESELNADDDDQESSKNHAGRSALTSNVNGGVRKKLRLTKEQSSLLEETFRLRSTLNLVQKQALAEKLNLKPRQVEVWFQNRRARTKLKQTEINCEYLKKCCENLRDENRRLKKELQELRLRNAGIPSTSFHMHNHRVTKARDNGLTVHNASEKSSQQEESEQKKVAALGSVVHNN